MSTVYEGGGQQCVDRPVVVRSLDAYLASVVTAETRRGSRTCPWLVRVSRGQTINVTLLDFAAQHKIGDVRTNCATFLDTARPQYAAGSL